MKLSTIWYKANRELTQVQRHLGDRSNKTACAMGAIFYYDAVDKNHDRLANYTMDNMRQRKTLIPAIQTFEREYGSIMGLNDGSHWTFLQFARKAKVLGL